MRRLSSLFGAPARGCLRAAADPVDPVGPGRSGRDSALGLVTFGKGGGRLMFGVLAFELV